MRIDGPQITGSFNLNGDAIGDLDICETTSSLNSYPDPCRMKHMMWRHHIGCIGQESDFQHR